MNIITTNENKKIADKIWDKNDINWILRKNGFKAVKDAKFADWKLDSIKVNGLDFYVLAQEDLATYAIFDEEMAKFSISIVVDALEQIDIILQQQMVLYENALFNGNVMKIKTRKNVKVNLSDDDLDFISNYLDSRFYTPGMSENEKIECFLEISGYLSFRNQIDENKLNDYYQIKLGKANKKYSYVTLERNFRYFENWDKYADLSKDDEKYERVKSKLIENNNKMIDQYLNFVKSEKNFTSMPPISQQKEILEDYLNKYLLKDKIQTVITNAAELYTYKISIGETGITEYIAIMTELFNFLQKTGAVKKNDGKKVKDILEELSIITGDNEDHSMEDSLLDALNDLSDEELDLLGEVMSSIERPVDPEVISDDSQNLEVPYMRLLKRDE